MLGKYKGVFMPKVDENLTAEASDLVNKEMYFLASWVIEPDDCLAYAGQWAFQACTDEKCRDRLSMGWVPQEDIQFIH